MKLKANIHFHTSDDPHDKVPYTTEEGIVEAARLGFNVLCITLHGKVIDVSKHREIGEKYGITIIPGVEIRVLGKHVVIINAHKDAELIESFPALSAYRKAHPESFVLAPHPYYIFHSLGAHLAKNIELFDGIEYSWFYSGHFNLNKKAALLANNYNKPFIATSDTHYLRYLDESYCVVDSDDATVGSIVGALRAGRFENFSNNSKTFPELLIIWLKYLLFL